MAPAVLLIVFLRWSIVQALGARSHQKTLSRMVHTGFSRGCDRCREKHLGCDQTTPACIRCTTQGLLCPGYRDQGGFLFKNQSAKVIRNGKQRHTRRAKAESRACSTTTTTTTPPSTSVAKNVSKSAPRTPDGPEDYALSPVSPRPDVDIFLEAFVMVYHSPPVKRTHLEALVLFYRNIGTPSPLFPILNQVAWQLYFLYQGMRHDSPGQLRCSVRALQAMRIALDDPVQRRKNETLLALIMLDLAERIKDARMATSSPAKHHYAAMSLISERDPQSFQDAASQSLLDATRYTVNQKLLLHDHDDVNLEIFDRVEPHRSMPYSIGLDHIMTRVLMLRRQLSIALRNKASEISRSLFDLQSMHRELEKQLAEWITTIPDGWHPARHPNHGSEGSPQDCLETYASYEIATIYNHWRLNRLLLLGISHVLSTAMPVPCAELGDVDGKSSIIDEAQTLCDYILSSVPYMLGASTGHDAMKAPNYDEKSAILNEGLATQEDIPVDIAIASRVSRWHLWELLQWMLRIVEDSQYGIAVASCTVAQAKEILTDLWG